MNALQMQELIRAELPCLGQGAVQKLARYFELLVEWNARINLTAITEPQEVAQKHFADSLLGMQLLPQGVRLIDVGTGAGFPGLPLGIARPDISLTLLDSVGKRVAFLKEACRELGVEAACIHARAEDAARDPALRAQFGAAVTRAVASVPVLLEYTLPFLYKGGVSLMYKGPKESAGQELSGAQGALEVLRARASILGFDTPWGGRSIILAEKLEKTPKEYPRRAGTAAKKPL